ncbi:MAG: D-alanine--poly(phosphoribitol) ligase subunit DltC [Desulfitobacteriaceae bacterium]
MTIRETILELLEQICGSQEMRLNPDIELFKEGLLDSFGIIELFVGIQEQLNLDIAPTEIDREMWATPNKIIQYLTQRLAS